MRNCVLVLLAGCLALVGCNGGTVDRHALEQDGNAVDSLACEGRLLADDIAGGDTVARFVETHASELAQRASNFEDALSSRPALPDIEHRVRVLARKAGRVSLLLGRLQAHPSDPFVARRVERLLAEVGGCP
jgi:hypothetical protein